MDEEFTPRSVQCIKHLHNLKGQLMDVHNQLQQEIRDREADIDALKVEIAALKKGDPTKQSVKATIDEVLDKWK